MSRLFVIKPMVFALAVGFSATAAAQNSVSADETGVCSASEHAQQPARLGAVLPAKPSGEAALPAGATRIVADRAEGQNGVRAYAEGSVVVERDGDTLNADWVEYDQQSDTVKAGDNYTLTRADGQSVSGKQLSYNLRDGSGEAELSRFEAEHEGRRLQGKGDRIELGNQQRSRITGVKFNTCQPGDESWYIAADELRADRNSGIGVVRNARLVMGGVPVLYTPWADFPINGKRKSGLLLPSVRIGSDGVEVKQPYYFNLAANYDATLTPGVISARGVNIGGEMRYLRPNYQGSVSATYMPHDRRSPHRNRYEFQAQHQQRFGEKWSGGYRITQVSDDDYYRDFYSVNDVVENINLNRHAWLDYRNSIADAPVNVRLEVQKYQTLSDALGRKDKPYAILPRVSAQWQKQQGVARYDVFGQFSRFTHESKQSGNRAVLYPSVQWNFHQPWGYVRPKIGVHATQYWLSRFGVEPARRYSRVLPISNVDAGMNFERELTLFHTPLLQTLEPRLFYNYVRAQNQENLPNFDSADQYFSYQQLFRENRYSGHDRINASNSLAVGLQTRFLDRRNGVEYFRAGIGQKFYFNEDNVSLRGNVEQETRKHSDLTVFAGGRVAPHWYADANWHYNHNIRKTERFDAGVRYQPEAGKVINVRYKYGRNEAIYTGFYGKLRHIDVSAQWQLHKRLYAVGRLNYSLTPGSWLERTLGLEYRSACGCWSAGIVAQRVATGLGKSKNAVFLTLQLKDLSNIGNNPYEQLRQSIPGYSKTNEVFTK